MLRNAICSPAERTGEKIRSTPGEPTAWPESARNGISRTASFFASLTQALSCNFTSMIAASGLCVFSHFSADKQSGKEAPTEKPAAATVPSTDLAAKRSLSTIRVIGLARGCRSNFESCLRTLAGTRTMQQSPVSDGGPWARFDPASSAPPAAQFHYRLVVT